MKAYFSLYKVAALQNKITILESKPSNYLNDNDLKKILDYSYTLLNNDDFILINGKPSKLTFFSLNNINNTIRYF